MTFHIGQAFFPGDSDAWEKLQRALRALITLGVSERTLRRWATNDSGAPSEAAAKVLVAILDHGQEITQKLDALFEDLLKAAETEQSQSSR
jgi:hypothetical protein